MPVGRGKYDDACTEARESTGGVAVALVVIEGVHGSGMSIQAPPELMMAMARVLRKVASDIEQSMKEGCT